MLFNPCSRAHSLALSLGAVAIVGFSVFSLFDLKNGIAYFYDRHRYDRVAKLEVAETIKNKQPPQRIKDLFLQEKLNEDRHNCD